MTLTRELAFGFQPETTWPVLASMAAMRLRATPLTVVNEPDTKIRVPSADALIDLPAPFRVGAQLSRAPVERLYASRFERDTSPAPPTATPAGLAVVNSPVA